MTASYCVFAGSARPFDWFLMLIHLRLRDLSGPHQRADARRRQAWASLAHAKIEGGGLQPVVAAKLLVIIDAVVLHVLGDGPCLSKGRRWAKAGEDQDKGGRQSFAITIHQETPFWLGSRSTTLHRLRHPKLARVVKKMARLGLADEASTLA